MKSYRKILLSFIVIITFQTCIEPFDHKIQDYDDLLIVQGIITNQKGPHKVLLTRTLSLNTEDMKYETDAIVTIQDKNGNVEILTEDSPGHYTTRSDFFGEIDNEYQLTIETSDNNVYLSEPVKLRKGPDIENVFTDYREVYSFENDKYEKGIDIKLNTEEFNDDEKIYLKWDYIETWEIKQKWNAKEVNFTDFSDVEYFRMDQTERKSCWKDDYSYDILLDELSSYQTNNIKNKVIVHLSETSPKPYYGYSILINQYTINKSVYEFWKFLKENNIDNGSVFDNIPYNPASNIESCNNDLNVYGYFDATYLSQKRVHLKSPIENVEFVDFNENCNLHVMSIDSFLNAQPNPAYALRVSGDFSIEKTIVYSGQRYCVDCSLVSTTEEKPLYWIFK